MALARIRKNDNVIVIAGRERGKTGKVLRVLHERGRVVVEHVNLIKRHQKPRGPQDPGGIIEREASLHLTNVQPLCAKCNKPARITGAPDCGYQERLQGPQRLTYISGLGIWGQEPQFTPEALVGTGRMMRSLGDRTCSQPKEDYFSLRRMNAHEKGQSL